MRRCQAQAPLAYLTMLSKVTSSSQVTTGGNVKGFLVGPAAVCSHRQSPLAHQGCGQPGHSPTQRKPLFCHTEEGRTRGLGCLVTHPRQWPHPVRPATVSLQSWHTEPESYLANGFKLLRRRCSSCLHSSWWHGWHIF